MKEKKECKILGYGNCTLTETGEMKLRVVIGVKSNSEKYTGLMVAPAIYLDYNENLEENLYNAINDENIKCYYETSDNIITGKTKVTNIIFE